MYTRIFRSRKYPRVFLISPLHIREDRAGVILPGVMNRGRDVIAISAEIIARGTKALGDKQGSDVTVAAYI